MFKPLLDKKRKRKMRIFNTNSEEWKKALLEEIDADQLPACYGGSMTDPDGNPMCLTKVILYNINILFKRELHSF